MSVIDASVAIAALLDEPGDEDANRALAGGVMSAVNYSEVIARLVRLGLTDEIAVAAAEGLGMTIMPFTVDEAVIAGLMIRTTSKHGLSLGDRACLALARQMKTRAVTADRVWADIDVGFPIEVIR